MKTINISDIQHFSVGDGPGIRTTVFLKGCNLRCPWCHNPEAMTEKNVVMEYQNSKKSVVSGKIMSLEDISSEVMQDADFYEADCGGVTVSGGECLLHSEEVAELLKLIKTEAEKEGKKMTAAIDTAICVSEKSLERVLPYTDYWLVDLKTADEKRYEEIGGNLEKICENIRFLIERKANVILRIPVIPDFNFSEKELNALAIKAEELKIKNAELLPFHRLCTSKYEAMGKEYKYKNCEPLKKSDIEPYKELFIQRGMNLKII